MKIIHFLILLSLTLGGFAAATATLGFYRNQSSGGDIYAMLDSTNAEIVDCLDGIVDFIEDSNAEDYVCFYTYGDTSFEEGVQSYAHSSSAVDQFIGWASMYGGRATGIYYDDGYQALILINNGAGTIFGHFP
jgi:hypothetical protein